MKILVTGAEGFIGTHLCDALERAGHVVTRIDNRKWSWRPTTSTIVVDFADPSVLKNIGKFDRVIHAAAQINVDYSCKCLVETFEINAYKSAQLIQQCIEKRVPLVYVSTSEVYGSSPYPIDERHPLNGFSPYAASKIAADRLCYAAMQTWPDWDCTIVRPFNTFGPGQRADSYGGVIAKFIAAAEVGKPLTIYGDGRQSRDYTYVEDTVNGIIMAAEGRFPPIVNLATGRTHRIIDIARKIIKYAKARSKIVHVAPRIGEVQCLIGDATLARAYGWEPMCPFNVGLKTCLGETAIYDDDD
jgi:UDP-glucose 4-epimerase